MGEPTRYPVERAVEEIVNAYLCCSQALIIRVDGGEIELSKPTSGGITWLTVRRDNYPSEQMVIVGRYGIPADPSKLVSRPAKETKSGFQLPESVEPPRQILLERLRAFLKDYSRRDGSVTEDEDPEQCYLTVGNGHIEPVAETDLPADAFDTAARAAGSYPLVGQSGSRTYRIGRTEFGSGGGDLTN